MDSSFPPRSHTKFYPMYSPTPSCLHPGSISTEHPLKNRFGSKMRMTNLFCFLQTFPPTFVYSTASFYFTVNSLTASVFIITLTLFRVTAVTLKHIQLTTWIVPRGSSQTLIVLTAGSVGESVGPGPSVDPASTQFLLQSVVLQLQVFKVCIKCCI